MTSKAITGKQDTRNTRGVMPKAGPLQGMNLSSFLSAIRMQEGGGALSEYDMIGKRVGGSRPLGAYQILESQWPTLATRAGLPGARWQDPAAQDRVAAVRAEELFNAFGSWDLVALAWIGGSESVRKVLQRGYDGPKSIQNPIIREYVSGFQTHAKELRGNPEGVKPIRSSGASKGVYKGRGWVNPVAGPNEYSGGSWMPNTLNHRGRTHAAMDVYAKKGTPIVSPVSGKVSSVKTSKIGGYTAQIKGDDGITYYFAHMADAANVKRGQKVFAGNHIGYVGNSGSAKSTSPHLHLSMKRSNGETINPKSFLDGSVGELGYTIAPMGDVYGKQAGSSVTKQMTDMLTGMSDAVAGGKRNPDVLAGTSVKLDPEPMDPTNPENAEYLATRGNQTQFADTPQFLNTQTGEEMYPNPEVP